jgi:hypothetical protein
MADARRRLSARGAFLLGAAAMAAGCTATPARPSGETAGWGDPEVAEGLAPLNEQPWSDLTANGWRYLRRTSSRNADIATDATAPFSPPHVLRIAFTPGMADDTEPGVHWIALPRPREVHARWWTKLSPGWNASPAGAAKMTFLHAWPDGQGQVYTALVGAAPPHHVIANTEWEPYGQKVWAPNASVTGISYGRWYAIDWHIRWESRPGAGDGLLRFWVDGVLNGSHHDVTFPRGASGFQQFEFAPTLQRPPRTEQYMYVDHTSIRAR